MNILEKYIAEQFTEQAIKEQILIFCSNTNRNLIGIEKDEKYFEIAKNRIDDMQKLGGDGVKIKNT